MFAEWVDGGKPTVLGAASGAVAGLVAITPASGYVGPVRRSSSAASRGVCYSAVRMKSRFGYDDALDVVGVHAVGGIWGALATGLFASVWSTRPAPTACSTEIRAAIHPGDCGGREHRVLVRRQH